MFRNVIGFLFKTAWTAWSAKEKKRYRYKPSFVAVNYSTDCSLIIGRGPCAWRRAMKVEAMSAFFCENPGDESFFLVCSRNLVPVVIL